MNIIKFQKFDNLVENLPYKKKKRIKKRKMENMEKEKKVKKR